MADMQQTNNPSGCCQWGRVAHPGRTTAKDSPSSFWYENQVLRGGATVNLRVAALFGYYIPLSHERPCGGMVKADML